MDKTKIVKTTLHHTAGIGGAIIIGRIIGALVPQTGLITKVCVPVGAFALGEIVGNACAAEMDRVVDEVVRIIKANQPVVTTATE